MANDAENTERSAAHLVSVMAPCRNERSYIDAFCDQVLAQQLPPGWALELLVADGGSDDGSRERLERRAGQDAPLVVVDNPGRIVSTGLNACLLRARGEIVVRMDIHTSFAPDYVAQCIAVLKQSGADNVGGPWVARGEGAMSQAIAAAFQCRWVVGGALSRDTAYEGPVDTVYLGCWPRAVFTRIGGFDEQLVRNQDDEHNLRLRLSGGRIWQSGRIRSWYQSRGSLPKLFAQQYQYGYWRPFVMRKHGQPGSLRQLVPALFVAALVVSVAAMPWSLLPVTALAGSYALYLALASWSAALGAGKIQGKSSNDDARRSMAPLLARLPLAIASFHIGYGLGTWRGLMDIVRGRRVSGASAKITR
ncbi:glycosyltransferase family 2 protein [Ottowia thiooxydans]|uniref:glycosyltransferase family 2 protein n=1 Tax=Ottowia thiooxydans TaxID=219182 RepID=UPI0004014758|nr:glycosyltransferase family 2 protein [Ottowia thiooxydans]